MVRCASCGRLFSTPGGPGRPRKRCDACRSPHAKLGGKAWAQLRARVLAEEPTCSQVVDEATGEVCGLPSTQVDHVQPLAAGGAPLDRGNLQGLCASHNASKGARPVTVGRRVCYCGNLGCPGRWHL
jgi:5-methylcytosine-specific restriction endonuclease McrA